jgi:hypothetical protein
MKHLMRYSWKRCGYFWLLDGWSLLVLKILLRWNPLLKLYFLMELLCFLMQKNLHVKKMNCFWMMI